MRKNFAILSVVLLLSLLVVGVSVAVALDDHTEQEADLKIQEAEAYIKECKEAIANSQNAEAIHNAIDKLEDAEDKLDDAKECFDKGDYDAAYDKAVDVIKECDEIMEKLGLS